MRWPMPKCGTSGWVTSTSAVEVMSRKSGNGVAFDGFVADCDVCALGNCPQMAHPNKADTLAVGLNGPKDKRIFSETKRRIELAKSGTSSLSKHHHTHFPFSGGFRCYRVWKLQRMTSATTDWTTTTVHAETWYKMRGPIRVFWSSTLTTHYSFLLPGVLCLGESHRRNHRLQVHMYVAWARNGARNRACPGGTASNRYGHRRL